MSNLESIVPPLADCKLIPEGEFDDCVFCWELEKPAFVCGSNGAIEPRPTWNVRQRPPRSKQLHRANGEEIYNAPTLAEVMAALPHHLDLNHDPDEDSNVHSGDLYYRRDEDGAHLVGYEMDMFEYDMKTPAAAALRLWLKLKGIEVE